MLRTSLIHSTHSYGVLSRTHAWPLRSWPKRNRHVVCIQLHVLSRVLGIKVDTHNDVKFVYNFFLCHAMPWHTKEISREPFQYFFWPGIVSTWDVVEPHIQFTIQTHCWHASCAWHAPCTPPTSPLRPHGSRPKQARFPVLDEYMWAPRQYGSRRQHQPELPGL